MAAYVISEVEMFLPSRRTGPRRGDSGDSGDSQDHARRYWYGDARAARALAAA